MPIDTFEGMSRSQIMKVCDTVGAELKHQQPGAPELPVLVMDLVCQLLLDLNRLANETEKLARQGERQQQERKH